ncbi:hypothetical protein O6H91_04G073400 [Diphasiastrum complanatum]|uniref:Uncharacterized protein n=1 Tax=Diphasiastrum complanatum TaxID=34168 RepID=A0ACC2DY67_DIPCM|nr:hypothetical protein O6H91_04G073400 [Diphasiastrum complanatum]
MGNFKDVTEIFKEAVRVAASKETFDEVKMAKVSSSLIMPKTLPQSSFTKTALQIMKHIKTMHAFVLEHRKDYLDRQRSTDQDRDNIEHEFGLFVKACRDHIDALKDCIGAGEEKPQSSTWLRKLGKSNTNADLVAHQHGIVLMLSERLHTVTAYFDRLRSIRFQESIDKRIPKRRHGLQRLEASSSQIEFTSDSGTSLQEWEVSSHDNTPEAFSFKQDMLDEETRALQAELINLMDTVQETERKMLEMSALNHLFSSHVLQQAQQIEVLYLQAVEASQNVDKGNKELSQAIDRNSSSRLFIILFLTVLPLSLLFLDWYNG